MKKIIYKIIGLGIFALCFIFKNNLSFIFNEINPLIISSVLSQNLYNNYTSVSSMDISVIDISLNNDTLKIIPINNNVILPINGIINKISKDSIIISTKNGIIEVYNINNLNYHLYQYYTSKEVLGYANTYYIKGDIELVINDYKIDYEKI